MLITQNIIYQGESVISVEEVKGYSHPVAVKNLIKRHPSQWSLGILQNEYNITQSLSHIKGVRKVLGQEKFKGKPALILEYIDGQTLEEYAASAQLSIGSKLKLAISITAILSEIHGQNIIHQDVNSRNILVSSKSKKVYICDFGIASRIEGQTDIKARPEKILGTLPYISPEQTGWLDRFVDERTDLYSLGVVLYELMTGQLPFSAESPIEMIHQHIAKMPAQPAIINPKIPEVLSSIILKLLAKDPEDRYQTAHGLMVDLAQCLSCLQKDGTIPPFSIAQDDISRRFRIPRKLYGRESEMEFLHKAFERARRGNPGLVLIAGHPGTGKTALVKGLKQQVMEQAGFFIEGKFGQYLQSTPYTAISQAFEQFVSFILGEPEDQFHMWRERILSAMEGMGKVISEIIPHLGLLVGPQPDILPLSGQDAQKRIHYTTLRFIRIISTSESPLVLFLDDLQWIDPASLNLLKAIAMDAERHSLLIIGAYRDNEMGESHPLMLMLDELKEEERDVRTLRLNNLQAHHWEDLLTDTLKTRKEVAELARLLHEKTTGNPFFTLRLLKKLREEGRFIFDTPERRWTYNMDAISVLPISENVAELLSERIRRLPVETQQILKLAAHIGNRFDLSTLSIISEQTEEAINKALIPALSEKIIITSGQTYLFMHDLIQQTAYQLADEGEKEALHLHIGLTLLNQLSGEQRLENIFTLADHLNAGQSLIQKEEERIDLATLNLQAGTKAKDTGAFAAAKDYFLEGVRNLPENPWETNYRLTFELNKGLTEAEFLNGDLEKSEELIHETLSRTKLAVEKAEMYNILLMLHTLKAEYEKAKDVGKHALKLLGFRLPEDNLEAIIEEEIVEVKKVLGNRAFASPLEAQDISDPDKRQVGLLLGNMVAPCYSSGDLLWAVAVTKLVNLALEFGNIPEFLYCYAEFGSILNIYTGDYQSGYALCKLSIELCNSYHARSQLARAYEILCARVLHWVKPLKQALPLLSDGYKAGLESGELRYAGYICAIRLLTLFSCSYNIDLLLKETEKVMSFTQNTQNQITHYFSIGFQLVLNNLSARTRDNSSFCNDTFTEADFLEQCREYNLITASCIFHILKAGSSYLYGNATEALRSLNEAKKGLDRMAGTILKVDLNVYHSLSLVELYQDASPADKGHYLEAIRINQGQLKTWADNCPENFMCRYLLVEAESARICGKDWEAVDLYEQAINSTQDQEFVHMEALANELAAKFWLSRGKEQYARPHLENAYYLYQRWGAYAKVKDLESRYRHLLTRDTGGALTITQHLTSGRLDMEACVDALQTLSAKLDLQDLLNNIIDLVIAHSGAERALLIQKKGDDWFIQAMSDVVTNIREVLQNSPFRPQTTEDPVFSIPEMVFRYCLRSKKRVVSGNALQDPRIQKDRSIQRRQVKSMACIPILVQNRVRAMIYLENNLMTDVFSLERMEILRLLSAQFSISIENAILYHDLKQNADTIRKSEERYEMAIAGTSAGIWDWDIPSGKVFLSGRLKNLLGYSTDDFLETLDDFWDRLHPEDKEATRIAFTRHLKEHIPYDLEYRLRTKSGDYHWFNARGQAIWDETGKATRMSGSIIDICARKHAEEELKRAFEDIRGLKERLEQENIYLLEEMGITQNYGEIIGQSRALKKVLMKIKKVAPSDSSVLISGETGTGKELIARAIHNLSDRKDRPMVKVNCAALPSALIESELFGREKGAYTGALSRQVGRFEIADNSTIFLDEIGELSPELQAKLLRVIQDGEFERLGSSKTIKVNVRVIAATNRDLEKAVAEGRFREDLFYRLNVFPLRMPPLRERVEDIPTLVWAFAKEFGQKMGKNIQTISIKSMDLLRKYNWPGNIRELRNVIEHAMLMSEGNHLKVELPAPKSAETTSFLSLEEMECEHIKAALKAAGWRIRGSRGAAELLQIKPSTLYSRMEKLGIPTRRVKDDHSNSD